MHIVWGTRMTASLRGFTLMGMSMVITLPDEAAERVTATAAARGVSAEMIVVELVMDLPTITGDQTALEELDPSPLLADNVRPVRRRRLAFVGIGASTGGTSHRIDELLADGFGRD